MFLASIGTCAGIYVLNFLHQRGLSSEDVHPIQRVRSNHATGRIEQIDVEIQVPPDFPERYHAALARSAEFCAVKKYLEHPPHFNVMTQRASVAMP